LLVINLCTKCRFSWVLQFAKNNANFNRLEEYTKKAADWKKFVETKACQLKMDQALDWHHFTAGTPEDVDSDDAGHFELFGVGWAIFS